MYCAVCVYSWCRESVPLQPYLDGAFSTSSENVKVIREVVAETDVFVQVGGGIRSIADARGWLDAGVDRIIVSTFATKEPKALTRLHRVGAVV